MNDTSHELPSPVELPAPVTGANPGASEQSPSEDIKQGTHEKLPLMNVEAGMNSGTSLSVPSVSQSSPVDDHTNQVSSITGATPQIADDADLIEKEWVEKAKEIVEKTHDNPYLQNKAINEMKSDYIKKRYNKEITNTDASS